MRLRVELDDSLGEFHVVFCANLIDRLPDPRAYLDSLPRLVAPGGLLLVDNVFGTSGWWIDDLTHPDSAATDRMNRRAAADGRFDAAGVFVREGLLVARRRPGT